MCDGYACLRNISFNASKSEGLAILSSSRYTVNSARVNCLPTINSLNTSSYLLNLVTQQNDADDISNRRYDFIRQVNNALCYFSKLSSFVRYNLYRA
jgi:hypothetical protein